MTSKIDKFLIINLKERKDRWELIMKELKRMEIPQDKIVRIDAIKREEGWRGCTESHIKALNLIKERGWKMPLILEDDVFFTCSKRYLDDTIEECLINKNIWSVVLLNYYFSTPALRIKPSTEEEKKHRLLHYPVSRISDKFLRMKTDAVSASCYMVHESYVNTLISNFQESLVHGIPLDVSWFKLQKRDRWVGPLPPVGMQRAGYSNICKTYIPMPR